MPSCKWRDGLLDESTTKPPGRYHGNYKLSGSVHVIAVMAITQLIFIGYIVL